LTPPGTAPDHLLAEAAQQHALPGDVRKLGCHTDDVALRYLRVETEQQVGRGQVKKMQRVRLQDLAIVHEPPDLVGGRGQVVNADHLVQRLGRRQVVAHRTDATQPLHHHRDLPVGSSLDEFFEAAELDDVQPHLLHLIVVVEQDRDLAMPLNAGDRLDDHPLQAGGMCGGFKFGTHRATSGFAFNRTGSGRGRNAACAPPADR
jgi:hypothetical protein